MKRITIILLFLVALNATAQDENEKKYFSFSTEMIFSWATIDNQGNSSGNIMRWAPVFNPQAMFNYDVSEVFGLFTGMAVRNVGFIYEDPYDIDNAKYKYRTYNFGIPIGVKIGKMNKVFFFAGYEIEFPFVYKEKKFVNESRENKDVIWFSDKVETFQQSVMVGVQLPYGATLKFKYYLTNFHNRNYVAMVDGMETKPYDFDTNVFYVSIAWNVFTNWREYFSSKD